MATFIRVNWCSFVVDFVTSGLNPENLKLVTFIVVVNHAFREL